MRGQNRSSPSRNSFAKFIHLGFDSCINRGTHLRILLTKYTKLLDFIFNLTGKTAIATFITCGISSNLSIRERQLEAAERARLEAENKDRARFRSEFFGQLSKLLEGREGVRVVGDRFVFSSEVLFNPGSADLAPEGRAQIASVVSILNEVKDEIPEGIDWIIRVDGHTDNVPLSGSGAFSDNWQLSQGRALSVVRFMQDELGFPPERMAATGFGEYQPVAAGDSAEARAQNRRIELKLTEK